MEGKYRKIEFGPVDIESAMKELKNNKDLVCGEFNGEMLYSGLDDLDSAYNKITGKTKAEFDEAEQKRQEEYARQKKEHQDAIPRLTKEWIEKGKDILNEKYHELWTKCVPIRLGDLYQGIELGYTLDIVKELNSGCELQKAKTIIVSQGHSGMSWGLVCSMVKDFSDRGKEFVEFANA